jgi:hypothetical protein
MYCRAAAGIDHTTHASQHCSSASRSPRRAHHSAGCHQYRTVAAVSISRTQWSRRRRWASSCAKSVSRCSGVSRPHSAVGRSSRLSLPSAHSIGQTGPGTSQTRGHARRPSRAATAAACRCASGGAGVANRRARAKRTVRVTASAAQEQEPAIHAPATRQAMRSRHS